MSNDTSATDCCNVTFFIACYNEEDGIIPSIETVVSACNETGITYDIVVIDDASTDASISVIKRFMERHPEYPLMLVENRVNQGFGANFAAGAFFGSGKYYRVICGDDTESKETLVEVLKHLGKADMILTYHSVSARGWQRRSISAIFTFIVNILSGYRIKYYNGLGLHTRYNVMRWHSNSHGFGIQADLITRLLDMGATFIEIPVVPRERAAGSTKAFTFRNFCSVGNTFVQILIRRVARALNPDKVGTIHGGQIVTMTGALITASSHIAPPGLATEPTRGD